MPFDRAQLRVCIVAENASFQFGGEASLPLHYYSRLRERGVEAWLIVHGRRREELVTLFPSDEERILLIPDRWYHRIIWRLSYLLPRRVSGATFGNLMVLLNQLIQRQIVRRLVVEHHVNVVHQPIPVSPRAPSLICGVGAPVVIGPMNGGMDYPPAFREIESRLTRILVALGRYSSDMVNRIIPGKKLARLLLVANQRTRMALPACVRGEIVELAENGVDLDLWSFQSGAATIASNRFLFVGRLVDWKRLDLVLRALSNIPGARLDVIGDGPMRSEWTRLAADLNLSDRVNFLGWMTQANCAQYLQSATALLLPSIYECGGAVILEAMGMGVPVVAVAWGGPDDYLDPECGVLVVPASVQAIVDGFTAAMRRLMEHPDLRTAFGRAARKKVEDHYDWEEKIDRILELYSRAIASSTTPAPALSASA